LRPSAGGGQPGLGEIDQPAAIGHAGGDLRGGQV
jgi:hypothetical protein